MLSQEILKKVEQSSRRILLKNRIINQEQIFTVTSLSNPIYAEMQAFWDSCFHAYVLDTTEPDNAKKEIMALLANMNEDGFIPHMIYFTGRGKVVPDRYKSILNTFWSSTHHSNLLQPPILALAVNKIFETTHDKEFLVKILPKLEKYYQYLSKNRDHDNDGLLSIIHSWESGWDNSQRWDNLYKVKNGRKQEIDRQKALVIKEYQKVDWNIKEIYNLDLFIIKPVDFNVLYTWNLELLSKLYEETNINNSFFKEQAHKTKQAIFKKMFDGKTFYDLNSDGTLSKVYSAAMFFPMLLDHHFDYDKIITTYLTNKRHFLSPYGVPSTSLSYPLHSPNEYWRGNIWIQLNWLIFQGLIFQQRNDLAANIAKKIIRLLYYNGFWEYFNPHTGEGLGARDYSWDSLVTDMINHLKKT